MGKNNHGVIQSSQGILSGRLEKDLSQHKSETVIHTFKGTVRQELARHKTKHIILDFIAG